MSPNHNPRSEHTCQKCGKVMFTPMGAYATHMKWCGSEERLRLFWSKVDKAGPGGCWLYMGGRDKWGYGDLRWNGKHLQAHRLAWKLLRGDPGKMDCLHTCHNPPCCNPDHLYLGTDVENSRDRVTSGRSLRGARTWSAKLTDDKVRDIRRTFKRTSQKKSNIAQLALDYEVSQATISAIMRGSIWKHVK